MAIEQIDSRAEYVYRLDPNDPHQIQRKPNTARARWQDYLRYPDVYTARAKLLRLGRDNVVEVQG
jgi:hypothetical protein